MKILCDEKNEQFTLTDGCGEVAEKCVSVLNGFMRTPQAINLSFEDSVSALDGRSAYFGAGSNPELSAAVDTAMCGLLSQMKAENIKNIVLLLCVRAGTGSNEIYAAVKNGICEFTSAAIDMGVKINPAPDSPCEAYLIAVA